MSSCASYSEAEEARGAVCQVARGVPAECESAGAGRDRRDQSHPPRLGELLSDRPFEPLFFDGQALGGAEDSAAHDERPAAPRDGLETVEYAVDSWHAWTVQRLPSEAATAAESSSGFIGRLTFDAKTTGERSAGDPHAPFDAAGIGNQIHGPAIEELPKETGSNG